MYQQTMMMHTKRVIFLALPLLFVPLVYSTPSVLDACAQQAASIHRVMDHVGW
jgi:hypothetical protein